MADALDTALCKMARSMPRKTSRRAATTSSSCSYPSPSHLISDRTGRRSVPSTGIRRTSAVPSFGEAFVPGSAILRRRRGVGYGGLAGEAGSAHVDSRAGPATLRRADTTMDTVTVIVCRIQAQERDDRAYYRRNEEGTEVTHEAPHAVQHLLQTSMTACVRWRGASEDGATAPPGRRAPPRRARTRCAPRKLRKEVHKLLADHQYQRGQDQARARAIFRGKVRGLVCSAMLNQ